jgi:hypothetical protein
MKVQFTVNETKPIAKASPASHNLIPTPHLWGLEALNLAQECADFYLLSDLDAGLHLRGITDEEITETLELKLKHLEFQFVRYSDMAVGGELRHASIRAHKARIPIPLRRFIVSDSGVSRLSPARHEAWSEWFRIRQEYGTKALEWARDAFHAFRKDSSYGGPNWARIAENLLMYEKGEITPTAFIDTCWGLQHNTGSMFSKAWLGNGLPAILDWGRASNMEALKMHATPAVVGLWEKKQEALA